MHARTPSIRVDRRGFLTLAGIAGVSLLVPSCARAADAPTVPAAPAGGQAELAYGVCGRMSSARMMKEAGCEYIEESVSGLLTADTSEEEFVKRLPEISASLIPVKNGRNFLPGSLKSVGANAKHAEILTYADTAFKRAKMVGIDIITFGSAESRMVPDDFSMDEAKQQLSDLLRQMGPLAAAQNLRVAVEPLNKKECNFLNNIREVAEVVRAANHPNIGITADFYHMVLGDDRPEHLEANIDILHHLHIAEKAKRAMPGVAGDDFRGWFAVLAKHGWKGRISIEAKGTENQEGLTKAIAYVRAQAKEAGI
jgi:sugar phosphate isomerase/epimerase